MSLNAIAVLRIPEDALLQGLGEGEVPIGAKTPQGGRWLASAYGGSILVRPIDDGTLVDLGHEVGDGVLVSAAAKLRSATRPSGWSGNRAVSLGSSSSMRVMPSVRAGLHSGSAATCSPGSFRTTP